MKWTALAFRFCSVVVFLSFGSAARAQDEDRAKAASILDEGNRFFEKQRYAQALERYEAAYAVFPSPKILFNIGEAKRELGQAVEAANAYAAFINEASVAPSSEIGVKARNELEELDRQIARLAFEGDLEGAAITIDGQPLDRFVQREVRVTTGPHAIRATRDGVKPFSTTITARAGIPTPVTIDLSETPALTAKADADANARLARTIAVATAAGEGSDDAPTGKWWFWTAVGGAAVVAVVVTAVAVSSGGSDRLPMGELPATSTADWMRGR